MLKDLGTQQSCSSFAKAEAGAHEFDDDGFGAKIPSPVFDHGSVVRVEPRSDSEGPHSPGSNLSYCSHRQRGYRNEVIRDFQGVDTL